MGPFNKSILSFCYNKLASNASICLIIAGQSLAHNQGNCVAFLGGQLVVVGCSSKRGLICSTNGKPNGGISILEISLSGHLHVKNNFISE